MGSRDEGRNVDARVVEAFGDEWARFTNADLDHAELESMFEDYAAIFPWSEIPDNALRASAVSGTWCNTPNE